MLRVETVATTLKTAGEVVSDSLLVAMLLKGLPPEFMPFSTVITQRDKALTFSEFKAALRGFEETKKSFDPKVEDSVMKVGLDSSSRKTVSNHSNPRPNQSNSEGGANKQSNGIVCYSCINWVTNQVNVSRKRKSIAIYVRITVMIQECVGKRIP